MTNRWIEPEVRDDVVATVERCANWTGWAVAQVCAKVGITRERFYQWRRRRGLPNAPPPSPAPRHGCLLEWERAAIVAFHHAHPAVGYRSLAWMMVDTGVVAVSPTSVWRVLKAAGAMEKWNRAETKKGKGFKQPLKPHEHWHSDISYLNIAGTFYYFFGLIDGASRYIVHWEIRESMHERDLEIVIERAKEKFPHARPRLISDNGPQYVSREFREFIRISGMTHVRTSPYYPQSNGKIERFHGTLKGECIRLRTPVSLEDARRVVGRYVDHYNHERLHSAIGYVAPVAVLEGRSAEIQTQRQARLAAARQHRRDAMQLTRQEAQPMLNPAGETETGSAGAQPDRGISGRGFDVKSRAGGGLSRPPTAPPNFTEMSAHA